MNSGAAETEESLVVWFRKRTSVELLREVLLTLLADRVDSVTNVHEESGAGELPATPTKIIHVEVEILALLWHQVSELGGLVVSPLADELENPFISFCHPLSGFSHTRKPSSCTDIPNSKPPQWIQPIVRRFGYVTRLDYWQPISCCGVWRQTGTYVGPSRLDDTDVALRAVCRRECGPVVQAPARVGSAERGSETMQKYDHATQDGFGEQPPTDQHCPDCGGEIETFERNTATGAVTVKPCGHDVAGLTVAEIQFTSPRVATDGGQDLDDDQVFWIRNLRAYIREHVDELDADDVQADTENDIAAAYIPTPDLDRQERTELGNRLSLDGFRIISSSRDIDVTIGYGDSSNVSYASSTPCEVIGDSNHDDTVQIVEDASGRILAACKRCQRDIDVDRVIDEDPGFENTATGPRGGA